MSNFLALEKQNYLPDSRGTKINWTNTDTKLTAHKIFVKTG